MQTLPEFISRMVEVCRSWQVAKIYGKLKLSLYIFRSIPKLQLKQIIISLSGDFIRTATFIKGTIIFQWTTAEIKGTSAYHVRPHLEQPHSDPDLALLFLFPETRCRAIANIILSIHRVDGSQITSFSPIPDPLTVDEWCPNAHCSLSLNWGVYVGNFNFQHPFLKLNYIFITFRQMQCQNAHPHFISLVARRVTSVVTFVFFCPKIVDS